MNPPPLDLVLEIKQVHPIMWSGRSRVSVRLVDRTTGFDVIELEHATPNSLAPGAYPSSSDVDLLIKEVSRALRHQLIHHVDP